MSVGITNKQASHEMSMVLSEGAVANKLNDVKQKTGNDDTSSRIKTSVEDPIAHILESNNAGEAGLDILRNLATRLASTGIVIQKAIVSNDGEFEKVEVKSKAKGDDDADKDTVSVRTFSPKTILNKSVKNINLNLDFGSGKQFTDKETVEIAEKYAGVFYESLTDEKSKPKEKMKQLETMLKAKGLSDENIINIQKQVRAAIRADISIKIKEALLFKELSGSKMESEFFKQAVFSMAEDATAGGHLGAQTEEEAKAFMQETINNAASDAKKELGELSLETLEHSLMKKMVSKEGSDEDITKLITLSRNTGKDVKAWSAEWARKKEDLGFNLIETPAQLSGQYVNTSSDNQDSGERNNREYIPMDEIDIMAHRLKALYMLRLMTGGIKGYLSTAFKIRKVKGGMMKLGIFTKEVDDRIKAAAEKHVKENIKDMLDDAMIEKASLFSLKGSSFKLIEMKIKGLVQNARRMGIELNEAQIESMQYKANQRMIDIVGRQIEFLAPIARQSNYLPAQKNLKKLQELFSRLENEMQKGTISLNMKDIMKSEVT